MKRLLIAGILPTIFCIAFLATICAINVNSISIPNSSRSSGTIDVIYQVAIRGENDNRPVSDAKVTLVIIGFDNNTNSIRVLGKADVPDNPLLSSNRVIAGESTYVFPNLPAPPRDTDEWIYAVSTERNGRTWMIDGPFYGAILRITTSNEYSYVIPSGVSNGTLYGYVVLNDGNLTLYEQRLGGGGVKVTLYSCLPYDESKGIVNTGIVDIPNNPQITPVSGGQVGMYRFDGLTPGFYNVTVEKDGLAGHTIINFTRDEDNNNWICNNIVLLQPAPPHPTVTPTPRATMATAPVVSQTMGPSPSSQSPLNATAPDTATPVSTGGFQLIMAIASLAITCGVLLHKWKRQ